VGGLIGHCVSPPTVERDRRACIQGQSFYAHWKPDKLVHVGV